VPPLHLGRAVAQALAQEQVAAEGRELGVQQAGGRGGGDGLGCSGVPRHEGQRRRGSAAPPSGENRVPAR